MADGRNRIANGVNPLGYDAKGNIVTNGTYTFGYSSENLMTSLTNPVGTQQHWSTYAYDPLMRLAVIDSSNPVLDAQLGYDGLEVIYEGLSNNRTRRYVHGPGVDEPLAAYLVTSTGTSRTWFHADERGSILVQTNDNNNAPNLMGSYDEYGVGIGSGRFHYTGQYQLADAGLHYYRARIYDPKLGRFLQPDPIGYEGGMNLYAYVGGDPVNFTDPLGLQRDAVQPVCYVGDTCVNGPYLARYTSADLTGFGAGQFQANTDVDGDGQPDPDIVITGKRSTAPRRTEKSLVQRAADCALDQFGVTDLVAAGAIAAGQPIPGTKRFVSPGSSRGTSVAGMAANKVFGQAQLPRRLPTIVGGPGTGRALAIAGTKSVARFAGRAIPIVGWVWLAYDVVSIAACTARSR